MQQRTRVLIIGLDCVPPELVFTRWRADLPNLRYLMEHGVWGSLESCIPAITVPAWSSMMASKDPGTLGFYGFRNRGDYSYDRQILASADSVRTDRVWDLLSRAGKKVITIGVPQTYPPRAVNGIQVGCFLTPSVHNPARPYTYPAAIMQEIEEEVGEYLVDVPNFRTEDKEYLLRQIYAMTEKRWRLVQKWLVSKEWDFFMFVEMGTDRIHHGLWRYLDASHPRYEHHPRYSASIFDYYRYLDSEIGRILQLLDEQTIVFVISDHGAQRMEGGICINEWLLNEGYLALTSRPETMTPLGRCEIDWSRTRVWGDGGYYGRIFLNIQGREPQGIVRPDEVQGLCDELISKLEALPDPAGANIGTRVFRPREIYRQCEGIPPDLIVYFGNLYWRSVGSVGHPCIYTFSNDTGPDDCNHAQFGILIRYDPAGLAPGANQHLEGLQLMDIAPTVLRHLDVAIPPDMQGRVF